MAQESVNEKTLTTDDAVKVLHEILDAQNEAHLLGLVLNVKPRDVEAIQKMYPNPRDQLLHIIIKILQQAEPRPTWRIFVDALKSELVGHSALAERIARIYHPHPSPTSDGVSEIHTIRDDDVKPKYLTVSPCPPLNPCYLATEKLERDIKGFNTRLNAIKIATIEYLEKCCVPVKRVVFILTTLMGVGEHIVFLKEELKELNECENHYMLFQRLNFHCNPLSYRLLQGLLKEVEGEMYERELHEIREKMVKYDNDMAVFRESTSLVIFCHIASSVFYLPEANDPPLGFREIVIRYNWPPTKTLQDVENFRIRFSSTYGLPECALMVNRIIPGSFIIVWFAVLPPDVMESLNSERSKLFTDSNIISVDIPNLRGALKYILLKSLCLTFPPWLSQRIIHAKKFPN